jgi:hypothetical protein
MKAVVDAWIAAEFILTHNKKGPVNTRLIYAPAGMQMARTNISPAYGNLILNLRFKPFIDVD